MIKQVTLTLEVLCDDGTVLRVPVAKIPNVYNVEDARVFHSLNASITRADGRRPPVYDEELLCIMTGELRKALDSDMPEDSWPNGNPPFDLLDRMAMMLANQLRCKNAPPPT